MDLNYLLERHQVSLIMAERAASDEARRAHQALADGYAARITVGKYPAPRTAHSRRAIPARLAGVGDSFPAKHGVIGGAR